MLRLVDPLDSPPFRLGAILAGGRSRRFGSPKALARLAGVPLVERLASTLRRAHARPVAVSGPGVPDLAHLLPVRQDERPGLGPLSGVQTALGWARELGATGCLCIACDLPLVSPGLLGHLAALGERSPDTVVAPGRADESGIQPLCTWYPVSALEEVASRLESGRLSMRDLLQALPVVCLGEDELRALGDPSVLFLNVNTPADLARAARLLATVEQTGGVS